MAQRKKHLKKIVTKKKRKNKKETNFVEKEQRDRLKRLISKYHDLPTLCEKMKLSDREVIGLVELMKDDGELVDYVNGEIVKLKKQSNYGKDTYVVPNNLSHLSLLLISDTHLASKYDRLDILDYLYDEAEKRGVKIVLHAGDLSDGRSQRDNQLYELRELSFDGQVKYIVDNYPKRKGITTYFIEGNHDLWWNARCGSSLGRAVAKERPDMIYLGADTGDLMIGKLKVKLFHGTGGIAYAKSYKVQKFLDNLSINERPDILQTGHIHQAFYMKQDFTHCFQTGCLEDTTPFVRSLGIGNNDKSCWWVDVDFDKTGEVKKITPELEDFSGPKKVLKRK